MLPFLRIAALPVAALLLGSSPVSSRGAPADFFAPPDFADFAVSPDGEHLAAIAIVDNLTTLAVIHLATGQLQVTSPTPKIYATALWWCSPHQVLVQTTNREHDQLGYTVIDIAGGAAQDPWRLATSRLRVIDGLPEQPAEVLVTDGSSVSRFHLSTGKRVDVTGKVANLELRWLVDAAGAPRAAVGRTIEGVKVFWRAPQATAWRSAVFTDAEAKWIPSGFDEDERYLWTVDWRQGDTVTISKFDTVTETHTPVFARRDGDPLLFYRDEKARTVLGFSYEHLVQTEFFPILPELGDLLQRLAEQFPGYTLQPLTHYRVDRPLVLLARGARQPGAILRHDARTGVTSLVTYLHGDRMRESNLISPTPVSWMAADHSPRSGILGRPRDVSHPPLAVLMPSAFPSWPARNEFNAFAQALADAGFAVAVLNVPGTLGFGQRYRDAVLEEPISILKAELRAAIAAFSAEYGIDGERVALLGERLGGSISLALAVGDTPIAAVVNNGAPLEVSREDLYDFGTDRRWEDILNAVGGWAEVKRLRQDLAVIAVAPRVEIPVLHIYPQDPGRGEKLGGTGRRMAKAIAGLPQQQVVPGFRWTNNVLLPQEIAADQSAIFLRILSFLNRALPER